MDDANVYGYVNGKAVYSRDEFIFTKRGFETIETDAELLKYAEKVTSNWYNAGHHHTFTTYYLGDYALDEPQASLTTEEYKRLKELQAIAKAEYEAEQAKYNYENYEGRPLTETEVRMFLDRKVELTVKQWGETNFYSEQAREWRDKQLSKFKNGEVIAVDSHDYVDSYGGGTGNFDRTLYSDGTIKDGCYGYTD
jgi:hypothetical protein